MTPVMDFQIDNITIHHLLINLRTTILRELQEKVLKTRTKDSLEIFLTMFILLYNIELTIAHDRWFARRWNVGKRFSNYPLIENIFSGANILLTFFHRITKGGALFSQNWQSPANKSMADLGDEQARYMKIVSREVYHQRQSLHILTERSLYEDTMYWCSQLFHDDQQWKPVVAPCV